MPIRELWGATGRAAPTTTRLRGLPPASPFGDWIDGRADRDLTEAKASIGELIEAVYNR